MEEKKSKVQDDKKAVKTAKADHSIPQNKISEDERIMAAISHASIILGFGILIALVIWITQKDKSKYVAFQSLQALVYQIALMVLGTIAGMVYFVLMFIITVITMGLGAILGVLAIPVMILLVLIPVIYAFYAAYQCYNGNDFRYAAIGDYLARKSG